MFLISFGPIEPPDIKSLQTLVDHSGLISNLTNQFADAMSALSSTVAGEKGAL
jgi:hypothetical protein